MPLVQYGHVTQQLPAQRPDHALDVGVLSGAPIRGADLLSAAGRQEGPHAISKDSLVVSEYVRLSPE